MIDFDKLCNEFCTGMDLYKTITKLHHMDIKYHVVNTDNTFCFMIPIIDGIAEIEIDKSRNSVAYLSSTIRQTKKEA
jgi:hypothetical protein